MDELVQVTGAVPVALKRRLFSLLALNGDKFRDWLQRKMEEDFAGVENQATEKTAARHGNPEEVHRDQD